MPEMDQRFEGIVSSLRWHVGTYLVGVPSGLVGLLGTRSSGCAQRSTVSFAQS